MAIIFRAFGATTHFVPSALQHILRAFGSNTTGYQVRLFVRYDRNFYQRVQTLFPRHQPFSFVELSLPLFLLLTNNLMDMKKLFIECRSVSDRWIGGK